MSRPNVAPSSKSGALTAEASVPSVPNVVIGVSTPPPSSVSEAPSSHLPDSEPPIAHADAGVQLELPVTPLVPAVRDTLVAPAMTDQDDENDQPASEERVRVAEAVVETKIEEPKIEEPKIEEAKVEAKPDFSDTIVDLKKPEPVEEAKVEEKKTEEKTEAKKEEKKLAVPQDEETIPPAGDLAVAEQFFSEGDVSRHAAAADDEELDELALDKAQRKSDPAVVQRRAKLAKYVTWAVGVSAALCLIAVVRTTFSSSSKTITSANAASVKSEVVVPKASPPPAVVEAPKAVEPVVAAAPVEPAKPVITGDPKEEKAKSKAALNKGKLADAIEAGEKSVALDETDSEAWLLLGAAYQEKGQLADAQRAYKSCLEKGTKDRFQRECRLFVR